MSAGTWLFTDAARKKLIDGTFDLDTDAYKVALFLVASDLGPSSVAFSGVSSEHAAVFGYTAGGETVVLVLTGTTTVKVDFSADPVWTASGGSILARFACLYEVGGDIICYCLLDDAPADVEATDGNTLTVAAAAGGVFDLA